ncbi:MAG TPA: hypothetical protein VM890_15855 [Longimicrobium sp.]|nr:hypothetical protein [Longimicrobium sp.]
MPAPAPDPVPPAAPPRSSRLPTIVRALAWIVLLAAGGVQAWAYRYMPSSADSISYLDVADTYARDGWWAGINGYWSPLYSWILAPVLQGATAENEIVVVHVVNFFIYLLALAAFETFLRELFRAREPLRAASPRLRVGWRLVAYAAFAWGCLRLVPPSLVTPDLVVAALTCLSTALLLRARRDGARPLTLAAIGCVAGLAYLAKAAMFPVGFVTLAAASVLAARGGGWRRGVRRGTLALLAFAVVAGPFAVSLSIVKKRPTFGEVGKLAYAWYVDRVQIFAHWQGGDGYGTPAHPSRVVLAEPAVYEFAAPVPGTYPAWYDASYWYEGVKPRLDVKATARVAAVNLAGFVIRSAWPVLPLLVFLGGLATAGYLRPAERDYWLVLLPLVATVAMYALVTIAARYLGAHLSILLVATLAGVVPTAKAHRRTTPALLVAAAAAMAVSLVPWGAQLAALAARGGMPDMGGEVARALHARGVPEGARVGVVGSGQTAFWARSSRVRIIAEAPNARRFWSAPPAEQAAVLSALTRAGATTVLADNAPGCERTPDWQPLGRNTCLWLDANAVSHAPRGRAGGGSRSTRRAAVGADRTESR